MVSTSTATDVAVVSPTAVLSAAERVSIKFSGSGLAGESSVQAATINIVKSSSWAKQDDLPPQAVREP